MLRKLKRVDWLLVVPAVYLVAIGLVTQYAIAFKTKGLRVDLDLRSQVAALVIGVLIALLLAYVQPTNWRRIALVAHGVSVLLLIGVLLFGDVINGAARWLSVGGFQFQPSEVAKITLIVLLARLLGRQRPVLRREIIVSFILTAVPAGLIAAQPDLGTAIVLILVWLAMLAASNTSLKTVLVIAAGFLVAGAIAFPFLHDYQQQRVLSFLNPSFDTSGANYNAAQAGIAIGSGGLMGKGLDAGSQSQLNFLPAQNTDFIFAVLAEKLGLLGAGSVIIALGLICSRLVQLATRDENQFQRLIIVGIATIFFLHSFVNIGMNLGIAPVTGVPLPLVSYGGTFLTAAIVLLAMALVVEGWRRAKSTSPYDI